MKNLLLFLVCLGLTAGACFAAEIEIKDQSDRDSYSLGYQYGETLKKQDWLVNSDLFVQGFRAGLGEGKPVMSLEEINKSLVTIRQRMYASQHKKVQEQSAKNYQEGMAFLEQNGKSKGVRTLPSGLQYKILKEGSGRIPGKGDTVTVNYRGTFIDGTEFDSSLKRGKPETFQVAGVLPAWTEALQLMKEGSKWQLFVPPELAYGETGQGSRIPRNSVLIFEIELLRIEESRLAGAPGGPSDLTLRIEGKGFLLTWKAPSNDPESVTGYEVERATMASGPFETIARVKKGVLKYHDQKAKPENIYYYKVKAVEGKEYSPYSNTVTGELPGY